MSTRTPLLTGAQSIVAGPSVRVRRFSAGTSVAIAVVVAAIIGYILLGSPERLSIGFLSLLGMILMMLLSVPIAASMILMSVVGLLAILGPSGMASSLGALPFSSSASWQLSVIPMFVLMGIVLSASGATHRVFDAARLWLGWLPGGQAVATNFTGAALAAASGSSVGIAYALGRVGVPGMLRSGYQPGLATGTVAASGMLGQLIPPSIVLVIYAGIAQTPVGPQLLASLVPGIIVALAFTAMIVIRCTINPNLAGGKSTAQVSWSERLRALKDLWQLPFILLLVVGGMYSGLLTATEAGAVGAVGAVLVLVFEFMRPTSSHRARDIPKALGGALRSTVGPVAAIMFLIVGVALLTRLITLTGLAQTTVEFVSSLGLGRIEFLVLVALVYIVLGMFLDPVACLMLTVPIVLPLLPLMDIDLMWFGVFATLLVEIGVLTPPVGVLVYIVHRMAMNPNVSLGQRISLGTVFKGAGWFVVCSALVLVLLVVFPEVALWLPTSAS